MFKFSISSSQRRVSAVATVAAALFFGASALYADERPTTSRIVNGVSISTDQVPSTVVILSASRYNTNQIPYDALSCSGALIQKRWVLTAAHCVVADADGTDTLISPADILILAGVTDLSLSPPPIAPIRVVSITPHPEYTNRTIVQGDDIALLELSADSSAPISQLDTQAIKLDDVAIIAGWGALNEHVEGQQQSFLPRLQGAVTLMLPYDQCDIKFPLQRQWTGISVQPSQLCAAYVDDNGGRDTCQGDSGGPIYRADTSQLPDRVVPASVVGIVSYGNGCAKLGYPGIYTNIQAYTGFINDTINKTTEVTTPVGTTPVDTTPVDTTPVDTTTDGQPLATLGGSSSGCSIGGTKVKDPLLPLLLLVSLCFLARRRQTRLISPASANYRLGA